MKLAVLVVVGGLVAAAGCGGSDEAAVTTGAVTPPRTPQSPQSESGIARRLTRAGYHVVSNEAPEGQLSFTTGAGKMIVYIVDFRDRADATAYSRQVSAIAAGSPAQVIARRVGTRVYSAVAAEGANAKAVPEPLLELIQKAEGAKAKPARLSPR